MGGQNFFDPMSAYFVPFNVEPPMMGEDGGFASAASETFGFGPETGTPVDIDMMAHMEGRGLHERREDLGR
jgi:hypothetical protein